MPERNAQNGLPKESISQSESAPQRCIDFDPEITNHPYPHPVSYHDNAWFVPQISNREVLTRIAGEIPIDTSPVVQLDGQKTRWFLKDDLTVLSYTVLRSGDQFPLFQRIADGSGYLFIGDYLGLKAEADIAVAITAANQGIVGLSAAAVIAGSMVANRRARKNTVSRRTFLKIAASGLGLATVTYAGVAGSVWFKQTSSFDSECFGGDVDSYHANLLPRNVGGTHKFLDSELSNRHGVWGTSHLKQGLVEKTRLELNNPRDTATTALLLETQFIRNLRMNTFEKINHLAMFVLDMTTSLQMALRNHKEELIMMPVFNSDGQALSYHPSVAPDGFEKYNPLGAGGVVRREAFINYASDVLGIA